MITLIDIIVFFIGVQITVPELVIYRGMKMMKIRIEKQNKYFGYSRSF